jgi:hypothetical protein
VSGYVTTVIAVTRGALDVRLFDKDRASPDVEVRQDLREYKVDGGFPNGTGMNTLCGA